MFGTTDDPASDLNYHKLLKSEESENGFKVLPAMRPDTLMQIERPGFADYLKELGEVSGFTISSFSRHYQSLRNRFTYFNQMGGRLSDHTLLTFPFC